MGGKVAFRAGGDRDGKSHGERSPCQEFRPQNGDLPRTSQKKGDLWWEKKKKQFGIKKESFAGNADGNKVLLKSSSFLEDWAGFFQTARVFKIKWKSWAIQGV